MNPSLEPRRNSSTTGDIRHFLRFVAPYRRKLLLALLLMLVSVALQLPLPFLTKYLVDTVIGRRSLGMLNIIGLALLGAVIVQAVAMYSQSYLFIIFRARLAVDIKQTLFERIQRATMSFFHANRIGYLMSRITDDVSVVQNLMAENLVYAVQSLLMLIAGVACTLSLNPGLASRCLLILPVYFVSLLVFKGRVRRLSRSVRECYSQVQQDLQEMLSGVALIRAFTAEDKALGRMTERLSVLARSEAKSDLMLALSAIVSSVIAGLAPLLIVWFGCREIIANRWTVGGLLAFQGFAGYLFAPLRSLYDFTIGYHRSLASVVRIGEMLDVQPEPDGSQQLTVAGGRVEYRDVKFSYDGTAEVLNGVSFIIEAGQTVALVGRSGAGKTTIASLLLKYHQPAAGSVIIDGVDIATVTNLSLRSQIGVVAQEAFLFSDTIMENIRFGDPSADDQRVIDAARRAHADEFVTALPDGYHTRIGERGCTLSGGQRQRLAIARAIVKDPKILILDEATSQVDAESERLIQGSLEKLMAGRTTIIVAHRLSSVQRADAILLLDEGRIAAAGSHDELLGISPLYRMLYATQFQDSQHATG